MVIHKIHTVLIPSMKHTRDPEGRGKRWGKGTGRR
jgi:hypothetical protein